MDRTAYKNRHIKEHYDRINLVIPKGEKDRIKNNSCYRGKQLDFSVMTNFSLDDVMAITGGEPRGTFKENKAMSA